MAKTCSTAILDAALNIIYNNVSRICVCKGAPASATNAESSSQNCIANTTCSGAGSMTLAASSVSGKKLDLAAFNGIAAISTGSADTICLISTGASGVIYWQTTCAAQTVSSTANTVNVGAFIINITDAT